jgi:hypothetical protein
VASFFAWWQFAGLADRNVDDSVRRDDARVKATRPAARRFQGFPDDYRDFRLTDRTLFAGRARLANASTSNPPNASSDLRSDRTAFFPRSAR